MTQRNTTLQLLGGIAGVLGLLLAAAALGYVLITGTWDIARYMLIAALVLLTIFVWLNPEAIARFVTGRGARYGVNTLVRVLAAFGIAVLIYVIWTLLAPRIGGDFGHIDVTANKQFTLTQLTVQTLESLPGPVTAIGFFTAQDQSTQQDADNLLKEYRAHTDKLTVKYVDPVNDPVTAREYNLTRSGVVIFDTGTRHEQAASNTEQDFTAALLRLRETGTKTVAVLDVPGSLLDFSGSGNQQQVPMSLVQADVTNQNYTFLSQPYNLVISPTISVTDVNVLIVPPTDQTHSLSDATVRAINDYLDRGGHVLLMGDPAAAPLPAALLSRYGLTEYHEVIVETDAASVWQQPPSFDIAVRSYPSSPITKNMNGVITYYSAVEAIQPPTSTITGFTVTPIVQSSSTAQLYMPTGAQGQLQPDTAAPAGPLTMIISVEAANQEVTSTITGTTTPTQTNDMRLLVVGDADFAQDQYIQQLNPNNETLFLNMINWLAHSEDRITVTPPSTTAPTITLDAAQQNLINYTAVVFMPLLVLLLGGYVWWRRR